MDQIYHRAKGHPDTGLDPARLDDTGRTKYNSFEGLSALSESSSIEIDINLLADGEIVVTHHKNLGVSQTSMENMSFDDVADVSKREADVNTPTFSEVLWLALDRGYKLVVEMKASGPGKCAELADKAADTMESFYEDAEADIKLRKGYGEDVISQAEWKEAWRREYRDQVVGTAVMSSFSVEALDQIKARQQQSFAKNSDSLFADAQVDFGWPDYPNRNDEMRISESIYDHIGISREEWAQRIERGDPMLGGDWIIAGAQLAASHGYDSFSTHINAITTQELVEKVKELGVKLYVFGVNTPNERNRMEEFGVDAVLAEHL